MEKLIAVAPSVAELVLDKCIITQPKYELPDKTETKKVLLEKNSFFIILSLYLFKICREENLYGRTMILIKLSFDEFFIVIMV